VNTFTKKSQWDIPTTAALPADTDAPPGGPPPSYDPANAKPVGPEKSRLGPGADISEDEKLARQLQDEENARAGIGSSKDRGESDAYYNSAPPPQYGDYPGQQPSYGQSGGPSPGPAAAGLAGPAGMYGDPNGPQDQQKKGLLGKLFGKNRPQQQPYHQPYHGGYMSPSGPPPGGYYGQGPYGQSPYAQPGRKSGIGTGGAAALGLGGGLLGGMLLEEAIDGHHGGGYGGDDGGYGGGDDGGYGGGDGGDGGGDFGGGDGGGGDF
jgi:hypothetical protein